MTMKKKDYQRPTMQVVKLQQQSIICSSPSQAGVQNYGWNDEEEVIE